MKRIRTKMLIIITSIIMVILLIGLLVSSKIGNIIIKEQIEEKMLVVQNEQKSRIDDEIIDVRDMTEVLGNIVNETYSYGDIDIYKNLVQDIFEQKDIVDSVCIFFEPSIFDESEFIVAYEGVRIDSINTKFKKYEIQDTSNLEGYFYNETKKKDELTFYYVEANEVIGRNKLVCNVPFYDDEGNFVGFIATSMSMNRIYSYVDYYNAGEDLFAIVDTRGNLISRNKDESLLDFGDEYFQESIEKVLENDNGMSVLDNLESDYLLSFVSSDILDWKILYAIPMAVVRAPMNYIKFVYLVVSINIFIIIGCVIFYIIEKYINKPINLVLKEFEEIANNTYDIYVLNPLLKNKDEFFVLGTSLRAMKVKLRRNQEDLEKLLDENRQYAEELKFQNSVLMRSKKELKKVTKYNKNIIDAIPEMVFIFTTKGICMDCQGNEFLHSNLRSEYIGLSLNQIVDEFCAIRVNEKINIVLEEDVVESLEIKFLNEETDKYEIFDLRVTATNDNHILIIARNITDMKLSMDRIKYLSYHDYLTGIHNKRYQDEILDNYIKENKFPISIATVDLNGLKLVNDSFGHGAGDELIISFAEILKSSKMNRDWYSRVGGDEFTFVFPKTDNIKANEIIDRVNEECKGNYVKGVELSASFGVATMYSEKDKVSSVLKRAEDNMYENKLYNSASVKSKTVDLIMGTLLEKNPREEKHSKRVADLSMQVAKALGMSQTEQNKIKNTGLLHDIGKIGVSTELLDKEGKLSKKEYEEICNHPKIGYRILKAAGNMEEMAELVYAHHEKWDGSGYPRGLSGEDIPIESRIIAIVDAYDAITSDRSYRKAKSKYYAISQLLAGRGIEFDPDLVDVFVNKVLA